LGLEQLPEVITLAQLAKFLQVSELTVRRALYSGQLKGFKIGRDWRIEKEEVIKWIKKK
jgi:DNA binding domain, excisionase family